jgi:hypothetical protein
MQSKGRKRKDVGWANYDISDPLETALVSTIVHTSRTKDDDDKARGRATVFYRHNINSPFFRVVNHPKNNCTQRIRYGKE